jgi:hypothetical protein
MPICGGMSTMSLGSKPGALRLRKSKNASA